MKIAVAKQFVETMQAAITTAEAQGRDELNVNDLESFAAADDAARAELAAAINGATQ